MLQLNIALQHRKKNCSIFPSPAAGMSFTKLSLGGRITSYIKYSRLGKVWYVTSRLGMDLSKSFVLRSNFRKKLYFLQGVCSPDCKVDDHCSDDEYCDYPDGGEGLCKPGCRNGADCGKCGDCVAHVCQEPECCTDADCEVGKNIMIIS